MPCTTTAFLVLVVRVEQPSFVLRPANQHNGGNYIPIIQQTVQLLSCLPQHGRRQTCSRLVADL